MRRFNHHHAADAISVEIEGVKRTKVRPFCCIWLWCFVCLSSNESRIFLTRSLRVCTTNALRIYRTATFSRKDFVNSLAQITLVSDLEPCLSMICACVPVILPALKRILGLHTQRSLRNRYDNTFLRLRAEAGDRSRSRGLDDAIPLTYTKVTASHKGTDSTPQSKLDNSGSAVPDDRVGSKLVIEVKNDWSVVSSP